MDACDKRILPMRVCPPSSAVQLTWLMISQYEKRLNIVSCLISRAEYLNAVTKPKQNNNGSCNLSINARKRGNHVEHPHFHNKRF